MGQGSWRRGTSWRDDHDAQVGADQVKDELNPMPLKDAQDAFTKQHVSHALKINKGKRARTARYLCISREGLWKIINRLGIDMSTEEEE